MLPGAFIECILVVIQGNDYAIEISGAAAGPNSAVVGLSSDPRSVRDGQSAIQNPVVEGLAAGRGGGNGLLLVAAAAAPAYLGFKVLTGKVLRS